MIEGTKNKKRPYLQQENRRQAILNAAHSLFLSKGYESVSVDEIVSAAGGSKSSIYQLFGGKKELLTAVTKSLAEKMLLEMDIEIKKGIGVRDSLYSIGIRLIHLILSEEAIIQYRLAINNLSLDPSLSRLWFTHGPDTTFHGLAKYLKKEVSIGRLQIENCQIAADMFLGMLICKNNIAMSIGEKAPTPKQMEQIVSEAVKIFMNTYSI